MRIKAALYDERALHDRNRYFRDFNMNGSNSNKIAAACLVLAGGKGRRLTPDKPLLEINNQPIIERTVNVVAPLFEEVLLVTNTPEKYEFLRLPVVRDERQGCGPLMGIYSGLRRIKHEVVFVCAADMPFQDEKIIRSQFLELGAFDIVVPCPRKRPEFLHAFYRRRCLSAIRENLDADLFKIEMLVPRCKTLRLRHDWFAKNDLAERIERESDIRDSLKCRSVVVNYLCGAGGFQSEFSFCLPNVSGLPQRQQETTGARNEG